MSSRVPRPGRRRRFLTRAVLVLLVLGLVLWGATDRSPVGHFASAEAKDRFLAAYATAMNDLPAPEVTLDVRTTYGIVRVYRFAGADDDRPPLLLVPARAGPTPVWADNLPGLLAHRSVYTLDLLGEPGLSVQDRPIADDEDQAAWLHEVLAALPEPSLHVVGLSIGGWTAMNLAVHRPEKIASLTLIEPVLVFDDLPVEAVVRSVPASVSWLPKRFRDDFASWTAGGAPVEDVPVAAMIEAGMSAYRLRLPAPTLMDEADLAGVEVPTLVILAADSPMLDSAQAAEVAGRVLRDGTVTVYPDASHAINGEYPDELAADIGAHVVRPHAG